MASEEIRLFATMSRRMPVLAQSGCYSLCLEPNATPAQGQSGISYGPATVGSFSCGGGTCTYNMGTYDNPAFGQNGVSIQVSDSAADSDGAWVQTYTRSGGSPQYDVDTGASNSIYTGDGTTSGPFRGHARDKLRH